MAMHVNNLKKKPGLHQWHIWPKWPLFVFGAHARPKHAPLAVLKPFLQKKKNCYACTPIWPVPEKNSTLAPVAVTETERERPNNRVRIKHIAPVILICTSNSLGSFQFRKNRVSIKYIAPVILTCTSNSLGSFRHILTCVQMHQ